MQLHQLQAINKNKDKKRVGRGGKRGTFSGHGSKGQKSRAGARIRPGFRGGDNPIWKLFPKQRGSTRKIDIKHGKFKVRYQKPVILSLTDLETHFADGEEVTRRTLVKKGLIPGSKNGVKILGDGELVKKLTFEGLKFSKSAQEKIIKAGGSIK